MGRPVNYGDIFVIGGIVVAIIGVLKFIAAAFHESKIWGVAVVISNFAQFIPPPFGLLFGLTEILFFFLHFRVALPGCLVQLLGGFLIGIGIVLVPKSDLGLYFASRFGDKTPPEAPLRSPSSTTTSTSDPPSIQIGDKVISGSPQPSPSTPRPYTVASGESKKAAKAAALIDAAKKGDESQVFRLLLDGVDANVTDESGWTPLMHAAANGHSEAAQRLLDKSATPDVKDSNGWTALHLAAYSGSRPIVEAVVAKGVKVNAKTSKSTTALICAAGQGHGVVVKWLIESGAEVDAQDSDGKTAMAYATQKNHTVVMDLLKKSGAKDVPPPAPPPAK